MPVRLVHMGISTMIAAIASLLGCQLLGEVLVRALSLPLPGPVAGMALMFIFLLVQGRRKPEANRIPARIDQAASFLLGNLSLLFVPAAVGIVQYFATLGRFGWAIAISIGLSTFCALLATVLVFRLIAKLETHVRRRNAIEDDMKASR